MGLAKSFLSDALEIFVNNILFRKEGKRGARILLQTTKKLQTFLVIDIRKTFKDNKITR